MFFGVGYLLGWKRISGMIFLILPFLSIINLGCAGAKPAPAISVNLDAFTSGFHSELEARYEMALPAYTEALRADPENAFLLTRIAYCHMELKQFDEAAAIAFRALESDSTLAEAHWVRGLALARSSLVEESLPYLEDAVRLHPGNDLYLGSLIQVFAAMDRLDQAAETLERIFGSGAESSRWLFRLGMLLLKRNHESSALELFRRVVKHNPQNERAWIIIGDLEGKFGRPKEAAEAYLQALQLQPDNLKIARVVLPILIFVEKWEDAAKVLSVVNDETGDAVQEMLDLAQWLMSRNEHGKAKALLEFLKEEVPDNPDLRRAWMRALIIQGSPTDVFQASRDLLDLTPGDPEGMRVGAAALADSGQIEESLAILEGFLESHPQDLQGYMLLGEIESRQGRWDNALQAYRNALAVDSTEVRVLFQTGVSLERLGDFDESLEVFRRLISMDPDNHQALNYIGYMCIDLGVHLEEAIEWVRGALEIRPDMPAYLDSLGWGYFQLMQYDESLTWLLKAVEQGGTDPEIYLHVAEVLGRMGRVEEASDWVHRVLKLSPDHVEAMRILRVLEQNQRGDQ